ncbi:MAG: hypothetical protein PHI70_05010 [Proteiniphilum sp.]|nr:hypothetical protein [Proteiniphilum sp.]MDD4416123.1 hypothetical protein [Proteiniphilum sp.]
MNRGNLQYIKGLLLTAVVLQLIPYTMAQEKRALASPLSIELRKARATWFESSNGAGIGLDSLESYGSLEAGYLITDGMFKRVQQGEKEGQLKVETEGGQELGNAYAWGRFSYKNETLRNTRFNTAMLNPYRGTPYYPVDPNLSDWKKQNYNLQMRVSSKPLFDRYLLGIRADYTAETGAKQVDPRSELYLYSINVKPGIIAIFGSHRVGLNLEYENMIQETRGHSNSDQQVNQDVFVMRGLGNHYTAVIGGLQSLGSFVYDANKAGAGLQYTWQQSDMRLFAEGVYSYRVEEAVRDITKPRKEGTIRQQELYGHTALMHEGVNLNRVDLSYRSSRTDGIEFVQVLDKSYEVQQWVDLYSSVRSTYRRDTYRLSYDFFRNAGQEYSWKAGLYAIYTVKDDCYIMPASYMKIRDLYLGADAKVNIPSGRSSRWVLGADIVRKANQKGDYLYGGADPGSIVITDFMNPEVNYLKQDYYKVGASLSYFAATPSLKDNGLFLRLSADYYRPTEGEGKRVITQLGMGLTF